MNDTVKRTDGDEAWTLKMKDLCEATGLSRQNVHFYIKEGLLPAGRKRGRNMAFYGEVHKRRLQLIRRLQEERFMPLAAIRALLEGRDHHFSPSQHDWLADIRDDLPAALNPDTDGGGAVIGQAELRTRFGVDRDALDAFRQTGIVAIREAEDGTFEVSADDLWLFELWAAARDAGLVELGLTVEDLRIYHDTIGALFRQETALFARLMSGLPAPQAAAKLTTSLELGNRLMAELHRSKLKQFLSLTSKES